ncbi:hypothetical protein [Rufibacter quisquiliarum]|uniref:Tissue inhibitor of metalloproteinase n=1 Tax=Rufibacter quisquiliarum TaxID=1549639 RepID=A0A839G9H6_9BACT|nr:hypothetical protein [Rufibacter quisquiliarum]MBA9076144.1 hypothetical protein [Rufibacter quisquiliarum]
MKKYLLLVTCVILWTPAFSCSCGTAANFIRATKKADIIALVKVQEYQDFFILSAASPESKKQSLSTRVEVIQLLKGKEERKEVKISGDNGILCRPYIDVLKKDQYYVVGLYKGNSEQGEDYYISICGEYWINYNPTDKTVKGLIKEQSKKPKAMLFTELQALIAKG